MQIDQIGLSAGVAGRARRDGVGGAAVMLTDTEPGGTTVFELLWVPESDTTAVASLEVTTDPRVWTFTPSVSATGPYRILLRHISSGNVTEEIRIFGIADSNGRIPPAPGEKADPTVTLRNATDPVLIARCERNWPTAQFPAGNPCGWYADIVGVGSAATPIRIEADWCLTDLPSHETDEGGTVLSGNSESGDLIVDSAPYGKTTTEGRFQVGALVLVPFAGSEAGLYTVNQASDDGWELEKVPLHLPEGLELQIRIRYGAQWGGAVFLTNAAELSWGPNLRIQPGPLLPYPILSEPLTCIETIAGGYPYGYQNNYLLVGKLNLIDASLAGGESLLYVLAPSDNPDAILGCCFGVKIVVGSESPLTITCGSGQTIEEVDGSGDSNAVQVPATAGSVQQWMMTPGGVWRVLPMQAATSDGGGSSGVVLTGNPYIDVFGTPHAADDEFDDGSADLAGRSWEVWNITDNVLMTRLGPVGAPDAAGLTSALYRSSRYGSQLILQTETNKTVALLRNVGVVSSPCTAYVRVGLPWGRSSSSGNGSSDSTIADSVGVSPCMALGAPGNNPFAGGTFFRMFLMSDTSLPRFGYTESGSIGTNKFPGGESSAALFQADTFVISTQVGGKLMYFWAIDSTKGSTVLCYQQGFGGEISINSPTKAGVVLYSNSSSGGGGGPSRMFTLDYFRFRNGLDWFGL